MPRRHEIPTHLNVEDRAIYGLTIRQVMYLTVGGAGGYALWNQWPGLPLALRGAIVLPCLLTALILALMRPYGRGFDEWLFVALHHFAMARASVWRPRDNHLIGSETESAWEELVPSLLWKEDAE
jgi:hypothetical protein